MTKTVFGADCWTDHRLVVSKLNLCFQPARRPQGKKVPKRLEVSKLKQDSKGQAFIHDICSKLDAMEFSSDNPEENWTVLRDSVHSSAMESIGPVSRKHQYWFDENDEEIQGLLEEKHQKYRAYLSDTSSASNKAAYSDICKTVQTRLRDIQESWLCNKADVIQSFADRPCYQNARGTFAKENSLWRIRNGQTSHGGQKKRYKDTIKPSLKDFSIPTESWEQIAQDRAKWRGLIRKGASEYEAKRIREAEQKRTQRKARAKASPTELSSSSLCCSICKSQLRARIGLISHLRTHKH